MIASSSEADDTDNFPAAVNQSIYLMVSVPYLSLGFVGDFAFLQNLPPLSAQQVQRALAPVPGDIEPLVRLIEDTPRNRLLEEVGGRIRSGAGYQQILSALMLAGVRGIQPRPVGFR